MIHLLHACGQDLDWRRLVSRYGRWWRVLLAQLVLFGFTYPGERTRIPVNVFDALLDRFKRELHRDAPTRHLCQGTLLSRQQFLVDVEHWGYEDARLDLHGGNMSEEEVAAWTAAIAGAAAARNALFCASLSRSASSASLRAEISSTIAMTKWGLPSGVRTEPTSMSSY